VDEIGGHVDAFGVSSRPGGREQLPAAPPTSS
jgi:hypothetical protein